MPASTTRRVLVNESPPPSHRHRRSKSPPSPPSSFTLHPVTSSVITHICISSSSSSPAFILLCTTNNLSLYSFSPHSSHLLSSWSAPAGFRPFSPVIAPDIDAAAVLLVPNASTHSAASTVVLLQIPCLTRLLRVLLPATLAFQTTAPPHHACLSFVQPPSVTPAFTAANTLPTALKNAFNSRISTPSQYANTANQTTLQPNMHLALLVSPTTPSTTSHLLLLNRSLRRIARLCTLMYPATVRTPAIPILSTEPLGSSSAMSSPSPPVIPSSTTFSELLPFHRSFFLRFASASSTTTNPQVFDRVNPYFSMLYPVAVMSHPRAVVAVVEHPPRCRALAVFQGQGVSLLPLSIPVPRLIPLHSVSYTQLTSSGTMAFAMVVPPAAEDMKRPLEQEQMQWEVRSIAEVNVVQQQAVLLASMEDGLDMQKRFSAVVTQRERDGKAKGKSLLAETKLFHLDDLEQEHGYQFFAACENGDTVIIRPVSIL